MEDELNALKRNNTWSLVPYSPSLNILGNKWVFRVKQNVDDDKQTIFVLIYVDDMIVRGSNPTSLQKFVEELCKRFALKDLGPLHLFLGIEVTSYETYIFLTQTKYIEYLLRRTDMANSKPCPTPAITRKPLIVDNGDPLNNPTSYKSIMGAL
ncbi:hypothetical protein UlMin_023704 [Ulmus minor]